jgi:hypothetical protein
MAWRDRLEGWIGGMNWRDGLEGWSEGWTDKKRMEGCCIVVLILFSRKAKFSYFRQKSIFAKCEIFSFSGAIFAKNESDFRSYFRENISKIYFRPNFTYNAPVRQQVIMHRRHFFFLCL